MFERITPYEDSLLSQFRRLEQDLDDFFGGGTWTGSRNIRSFASGTFPGVNVGATPDSVTVYLFAPGIDPKSLDTSIQQNFLSVSGERRLPAQKDATHYRQERFGGAFRRIVTLPDDVDPERVDARYVDGVVQIKIGRRESARPRQIQIQ